MFTSNYINLTFLFCNRFGLFFFFYTQSVKFQSDFSVTLWCVHRIWPSSVTIERKQKSKSQTPSMTTKYTDFVMIILEQNKR